jgi:hypothetical protein
MSAKERRTHPPQKRAINPTLRLAPDLAIPPPGYVRPETAPPSFTTPTRGVRRDLAALGSADLAEPQRLLADHAMLGMTGTTSWYPGQATCVPFIAAHAIGGPGDWRMLPLRASGRLAAGGYHNRNDQAYHPFSIVVLAALAVAIGPAARRHSRKTTPVRTGVTRTETRV